MKPPKARGGSEFTRRGTRQDQLIQLVRQGQSLAFEEIVRRYQQDVANVVSALLYRRRETEEIVQQVFVNVFVNLGTFQEGRDIATTTASSGTTNQHCLSISICLSP